MPDEVPVFHIMRQRTYLDGFDTIAYLHVEDEAQLLSALEHWLPRMQTGEALVAVNRPALEMLLGATLVAEALKKKEHT